MTAWILLIIGILMFIFNMYIIKHLYVDEYFEDRFGFPRILAILIGVVSLIPAIGIIIQLIVTIVIISGLAFREVYTEHWINKVAIWIGKPI